MEAVRNTCLAWKHKCAGKTDQVGLISLNNFTINGPSGLYTLLPSAGGVDSPQATNLRGCQVMTQ